MPPLAVGRTRSINPTFDHLSDPRSVDATSAAIGLSGSSSGREDFLTVTDFGEGDWTIPTGLVPVDEGFGYYVGTFSEYDMGAIRARADRRDPHGLARG